MLSVLLIPGCVSPPLPDQTLSREELVGYYATNAGVAPRPVRNLRFFNGGPEIKAAFLEMIREARESILIDSFLVNDGPVSRPLLKALVEKRRQGVRVQVIGDASSRFVGDPPAFAYMANEGIPHVEFHPINLASLLRIPRLLERDHRKFWIVDGRTVLLGGANLNDQSLRPPERGGNLDLMLRLESPEMAGELIRSFVQTWNEAGGSEKLDLGMFPVRANGEGGRDGGHAWLFNQDPFGSAESLTGAMFCGLYASARESVWLIQPYTIVNPQILRPVRELVRRGVEVNVVLSERTHAPRFVYATHYGIESLQRAGARVWISPHGSAPLHYKCVLVDDDLAYVGSANLNWRSFHLARESGVVFENPPANRALRRSLAGILRDCRPVSAVEAESYRTPRNLAYWMWMQSGG